VVGAEGKMAQSIFKTTIEPKDLAGIPIHILIEAHTMNSKKTTIIQNEKMEFTKAEHTLITICTSDYPVPNFWDLESALIVEVFFEEHSNDLQHDYEQSEQFDLQIDGITYAAFNLGERKDKFGDWEWTVSVPFVPIDVTDRTTHCKVRISGRKVAIPSEFRSTNLEKYWEGRSKVILGLMN
jgi:hypothetical protein